MTIKYRQDLPPTGGYRTFNWDRSFPRQIFKPYIVLPVGLAISGWLMFKTAAYRKRIIDRKMEDVDIYNSMLPFLLAERDRYWLKTLKINRALEEDVMKDVPGWKTGTWYGEPVYFTLGDKWWDPDQPEYYAHSSGRPLHVDYDWRYHNEYSTPSWVDKYLPDWLHKRSW